MLYPTRSHHRTLANTPPTLNFRTPTRPGNGAVILSLLIVVAIVLYLMFGTGGGKKSYMDEVKQTRDNGRETARKISTEQMSLLIAIYRQTNNKLPKNPADLESPNAFNDQWGKEMTFTFEEVRGKTTIKYHSAGPDGELKTLDDVGYTDTVPY